MLNKQNLSSDTKKLIVYIFLTIAVMAVFWQTRHFDFLILDDNTYVTGVGSLRLGFTPEGLRWAFTTTHADYWHPVTWLSLMLDYKLFGLNPGGYHAVNVVLHLICSLLIFSLLCRMTSEVWKSAFAASLFALHPLNAETVAWIALRRDLLCMLLTVLTLFLYVRYTQKPSLKIYLAALLCFAAALMSKPMAVSLPVIMILLDYWPLNRFSPNKSNEVFRQIKEKAPFLVLSAVFSAIALYAHAGSSMTRFPLASRMANAPVSFMAYLNKIFLPYDMAVLQLLPDKIPAVQVILALMIIMAATIAVIASARRVPFLFTGWMWYAISIAPVLGIIQINSQAATYHYAYMPSVGIFIMTAWGIPLLFPGRETHRNILFPAALVVLALLAALTWKQCGHWKNDITVLKHALSVSKANPTAYHTIANIMHNNIGNRLAGEGRFNEALDHYNEAIRVCASCAEVYTSRGNLYASRGMYDRAVADYDETIRLRPDYADAWNNKGNAFIAMGRPQDAIEDYARAIELKPDIAGYRSNRGNAFAAMTRYPDAIGDFNEAVRLDSSSPGAYNNRGIVLYKLGRYAESVADFSKALSLADDCFEAYFNRGSAYSAMKQYAPAIADFNKAASMKPDSEKVYAGILSAYFRGADMKGACPALKQSCASGNCRLPEFAKRKGYCK